MSGSALDRLTADLISAEECCTFDIGRVAKIAQCSVGTVRNALYRGDLTGSRRAKNGPLVFTARAVAEWITNGARHSMPVPVRRRGCRRG